MTARKGKPAKKAGKGAAGGAGARKAARPAARARKTAAPAAGAKGRRVYFFGDGRADGRADMKDLLGGKGANLAEMTNLGIPVPPGFTITTEVCAEYERAGGRVPEAVEQEALAALARVERAMDARFGDAERPLLVSVRSGARVSMPGMMDTVLNLGLNDARCVGLARHADERFAYDSYRRFIQMYGDVVLDVPHERFETRLEHLKERRGRRARHGAARRGLARARRRVPRARGTSTPGSAFPAGPREQLWGAIGAVFRSWATSAPSRYRKIHGIPDDWGTAVNVQAMVFGNMGDDCATGVAFTRDPSTGERSFYGEYLKNAQGEDVVAGIRTPQPINRASREPGQEHLPTLEEEMPAAYAGPRDASTNAREALPRHAGHRVHHPARASSGCCRPATASAPARRGADRGRHGEGGARSPARRPCCASSPARSTQLCTRRSTRTRRAR